MEKPRNRINLIELPDRAQPIEWVRLDFDQTKKLRYLYCRNYSKCLAYAALQHWESFVCTSCPIFREKEKEKANA